jgi:hypothetical protein
MRHLCYTELKRLDNFKDRYEYLRIGGKVGADTFGFDRYLNQVFYHSKEWRAVRDQIIVRDDGLDLGLDGYSIGDHIVVHHMNPITIEQVENRDPVLFDPEFLICCSDLTHKAIHYGDFELIPKPPTVRYLNDTKLW